jgi:parvulin-like peptidyl-prolyl isomerase
LVKTKQGAKLVQDKLKSGESFASLARYCSTCPLGKMVVGSLGSFAPGNMMVPEFVSAIFNPNIQVGELIGPIEMNLDTI